MTPIENWKSLLPPDKAAGIKIADYATVGDVIRIDLETIPEFTPRISARQHQTEDTTIPRICVCTTLMGCIAGYASFYHDFDIGTTDGKWTLNGIRYRGGMYIHRMPYDQIVLPANKLAGDSSISGEMWLIDYDPQHTSYPSELIGKVFVSEVSSYRMDGGAIVSEYTIYLEVSAGNSLRLTDKVTIESGYWKLEQTVRKEVGRVKVSQGADFEFKKVSEKDYRKAKGMGIGMLSESVNTASNWE